MRRLEGGAPRVRYLGYVAEADLPSLTPGSAVFASPSLYAGSVFPVVQAMAGGVPVVTSNISSLPAVTGDPPLLVVPRSVAELRAALERLLLAPSLRGTLAARGRERARQFDWEMCARRSLDFFRRVAGRDRS